jgi:hypothetical protein
VQFPTSLLLTKQDYIAIIDKKKQRIFGRSFMSDLKEKAEKAKEKVYRKRFINKMVEHVGTTVLQEDGKAVGKKAERGEYFIARVNKVWGNVMGRYPSGNDNPYNDEKSKSPIGNLRIVKGLEASEIDKMAEHDRRKSKEMSFSNAAEAERN